MRRALYADGEAGAGVRAFRRVDGLLFGGDGQDAGARQADVLVRAGFGEDRPDQANGAIGEMGSRHAPIPRQMPDQFLEAGQSHLKSVKHELTDGPCPLHSGRRPWTLDRLDRVTESRNA